MIAKTSKMITRSTRVSNVIGSTKRSSQIARIGHRNIEGSQEGRNMSEIGRKCRRELRDNVGRQRGLPVVTLQCTLTIITHGVAMSLAIAMPCYIVMCSQYI